jgi:alpha-galactosidase
MKIRGVTGFLSLTVLVFPVGLLAIDTDSDGLDDSVETGSGVYVSSTDTGTAPDNADSDGDGAGDWYEVAASFTDPNVTGDKPNIPYPLPSPDSTLPVTNKRVKVYILSGQSNMVGPGKIDPLGTLGTLATITRTDHKFTNLLDGVGWSVRNDVIYRGVIAAVGNAALTPDQDGATTIGPELGFGHVMGYFHDEPVLLIKSSQGGRALGWDFLPPSSVQYAVGDTTYAGYGDSPASWSTGTMPVPTGYYGGYQYDQCFLNEVDWNLASTFTPVVNVTDILDNFATEYPQWADQGFEIAGFAWWQGHKDSPPEMAAEYEKHLTNLIKDVRKDLKAPNIQEK